MDSKQIADLYHDAWIHHGGDMSAVPLAQDFPFTGAVASLNDAAGYRQMAAQGGAAVRDGIGRRSARDTVGNGGTAASRAGTSRSALADTIGWLRRSAQVVYPDNGIPSPSRTSSPNLAEHPVPEPANSPTPEPVDKPDHASTRSRQPVSRHLTCLMNAGW